MDISDISAVQERINRIALAGAAPDIIIAAKPEVMLHRYALSFKANRCTLLVLHNTFYGRSISYPVRTESTSIVYKDGVIHIGHIIAALANDVLDLNNLISLVKTTDIEMPKEIEVQARTLYPLISSGYDIKIKGVASIVVHEHISDLMPFMNTVSLRHIYSVLKGTISMTGKLLSIQAIVGGIAEAYTQLPMNTLYSIISRLESETSPLYMNTTNITDAIEWYRDRMGMKISSVSFYTESLSHLLETPLSSKVQIYPPQVELERVIIRPTEVFDIVDVISAARTSPDLPIIIANVDKRRIIKAYNKPDSMKRIELNWFMEAQREVIDKRQNMMSIVLRISRFPDRYQIVQYQQNKNFFYINRTRKYISVSEIVTLLCQHLNLETLSAPEIANTTYSFITNYIGGVSSGFGLDQHILAWLITNPPPMYRSSNIHKYIFVKEDTKPNALRDHISIHIQLGTEKLYLTLSLHETTSGTLVMDDEADLVGFDKGQKYIQVRINKAPTIHHARIAQSIYMHIISMYMKFYVVTRGTIFTTTGISLPYIDPKIVPLTERIPSTREKYSFYDPILYKHISDGVNPEALPVPIERDEAEYWRSKMHDVIRLPTIVINNPLIKFETAGEIWIRTPGPGRFILVEKKKRKGIYIPVMRTPKSNTGILVSVNADMTLTDTESRPHGETYIFKEYKSLSDKPGRVAYISKAAMELLTPILTDTQSISSVYRIGISLNVVHALNNALIRSVTPENIATYAHLCIGENWEQSLSDIREDILSQRIEALRHFRALEYAYEVNIYFLMDDQLEPYLRKPPHIYFYLHRESRKDWPTLIFHTLSTDPTTLSLITLSVSRGIRGYRYLFGGQEYLDSLMNRDNIIRMISPADGIDERLYTVPIQLSLGNWKAVEQVIDAYGKCRAITYKHNKSIFTLNIGFAPVQDLPIGDIKRPVIENDIDIESYRNLILTPSPTSDLSAWVSDERSARVLRIVTHLLYSQMDLDLDEFFSLVQVDPDVSYDTSQLKHALPNIQGSYEAAWEYFRDVLPGMVIDMEGDDPPYAIIVPDEMTKKALIQHVLATPKVKWPVRFPSYVQYNWDIKTGREEIVFLSDMDLIQYMIMSRSPVETTNIVISPIPYILSRGDNKYLIQMAFNATHAKYIAYIWDENTDGPLNPGYDSLIMDVTYPWKEVPYDFVDRLSNISFTRKDGRVFVIIPL